MCLNSNTVINVVKTAIDVFATIFLVAHGFHQVQSPFALLLYGIHTDTNIDCKSCSSQSWPTEK